MQFQFENCVGTYILWKNNLGYLRLWLDEQNNL